MTVCKCPFDDENLELRTSPPLFIEDQTEHYQAYECKSGHSVLILLDSEKTRFVHKMTDEINLHGTSEELEETMPKILMDMMKLLVKGEKLPPSNSENKPCPLCQSDSNNTNDVKVTFPDFINQYKRHECENNHIWMALTDKKPNDNPKWKTFGNKQFDYDTSFDHHV